MNNDLQSEEQSKEGRAEEKDNLSRLQSHLENDSLAHRLVTASLDPKASEKALSGIVMNRFEEVCEEYGIPTPKDN